jgi:hypothetical protein
VATGRRTPWERTSLRRVMSLRDAHQLLFVRALVHSVRRAMHLRGLLAADIFRAFDSHSRGCLSRHDLAAGLQRLGLQLADDQLSHIMAYVTDYVTPEVLITLARFREVFGGKRAGSATQASSATSILTESALLSASTQQQSGLLAQVGGGAEGVLAGGFAPGLAAASALGAGGGTGDALLATDIPETVLRSFKVKLQAVASFECVWSSRGTKSRDQAAVWQPTLETGLLQRNTARVCVGHYPNASFKPVVAGTRPSRIGCTLQVTDTKTYGVYGSQWMDAVVARGLPHPLRFRQVKAAPD